MTTTHPTRSWRRCATALALVALVAAGACSDDGDADADDAPTTTAVPTLGETSGEGSCLLFDVDEVTEVLGSAPEPDLTEDTAPDAEMPYSLCRWEGDDGAFLEVSVIGSPDRYSSRLEYVEATAEDPNGADPQMIEGLGDEAFLVPSDLGGSQISSSALVGDATVEVNLGLGGEETPEQVIDLLTRAVERQ